jgi:hypothetical protein
MMYYAICGVYRRFSEVPYSIIFDRRKEWPDSKDSKDDQGVPWVPH